MKSTLIALVLGAGVAVVVGVIAMAGRPKKVPDSFEPVGNFEIVTRTSRHRTGWNEGRLGWGTFESYGLRFKGKPMTIEGKSGMFGQDTMVYERMNLIVTFPDREPVILVNVGDPNNSSFFYLVREEGGQASVEYVTLDSGGVSSIGWLDPPADGGREDDAHRIRLTGGRYLLLADFCVIDTKLWEIHQFDGSPHGSTNDYKRPLGMAPDQASYVRFGWDRENAPLLLVFDFIDLASHAVPIDRGVQRFSDLDEIDAGWMAYYYDWVPADDAAHDRLVAREGVTPRPWKGVLRIDPYDGSREYHLTPVKEELRPVLIDHLVKEMGAELQPRAQYSTTDPLKIGDRTVNISFHDGDVGLWMDDRKASAFVEELGKRVDELLATGALDEYFVP